MTAEILNAAKRNDFISVKNLLSKISGNLSIFYYSEDGFSALHWAVYYQNKEMLEILLVRCDEYEILHPNNNGLTVIEYAAEQGYWDGLSAFLERYNNEETPAIKKIYGACLHWTVQDDCYVMLSKLLGKLDINNDEDFILCQNKEELTVIELAAKLARWRCLNLLVGHFITPNTNYFYCESPRVRKIYGACLHLIQEKEMGPIGDLMLAGADRTVKNAEGLTPLNSLIKKGFFSVIPHFTLRLINERDPNSSYGLTVPYDPYDTNNLFVPIDYVDAAESGRALYTLIAQGCPKDSSLTEDQFDGYIESLLKSKAPTTWTRQSDGHSLLHLAIEKNKPYWLHLLIIYGANLNYRNKQGVTPTEYFFQIKDKLNNAEYIAEVLKIENNEVSHYALQPSENSNFAPTETTESDVVKASVTKSIDALQKHYLERMRQRNWINNNLQQIEQYLFNNKLPYQYCNNNEILLALDCLDAIKKNNTRIKENYANLSEKEVLALIWEALCDSSLAADTKIITDDYINLRKSALISNMAKAQTDGKDGYRACFTGIIHGIATSLQGSHQKVEINYEEKHFLMDASENILVFVEQYLTTFSHADINEIYKTWNVVSFNTPAARFREQAKQPIADDLRRVYGNVLSDASIQQLLDQFDNLPQPRLEKIFLKKSHQQKQQQSVSQHFATGNFNPATKAQNPLFDKRIKDQSFEGLCNYIFGNNSNQSNFFRKKEDSKQLVNHASNTYDKKSHSTFKIF